MMHKVTILLATYNGENYINSQLISIIGQSFQDWELIIHDDGSTDKTIDIINKWMKIDSRIKLIDDGLVFGNAVKNFMHLLSFSTSEFSMFCDQDDIWFENKVECMYEVINSKNQSIPQLVYSGAYVWSDYTVTGVELPLFFPKKVEDFLFLNCGINGCFAIFNLETLNLMKQQSWEQAMHDHILQLLVTCFGEVSYIKQSLMLYRRHNSTVTKGNVDSNLVNKVADNKLVPVIDKEHYNAVIEFSEKYKDRLSPQDSKIINVYKKLVSQSIIDKIFTVIKYRFNIGNSVLTLIAKIIVRPFFK